MPQIIVVADSDEMEPAIMFRERVNNVDFESQHSAAQLLERVQWAVADAHEVEHKRADGWQGEGVEDSLDADDEAWQEPLYTRSASVVTTAS